MSDIQDTLDTRQESYGNFLEQSQIARKLQWDMQITPNWNSLDADQQASLQMIAVKIARILNGNPNHTDSWHDIAGYATLVEERLKTL